MNLFFRDVLRFSLSSLYFCMQRCASGYKHIRGIFAIKIFHCIKLISLRLSVFFPIFSPFSCRKKRYCIIHLAKNGREEKSYFEKNCIFVLRK